MPRTNLVAKVNNHPCFFAPAKGRYGRIHLPVAPSCNIQCAYCRRDHACVNESRPGVTRDVITPLQALDRLERALAVKPYISVAGIAGPGDAFCDPELTLETFALIRSRHADIALCVSSNGLNVKDYIHQLRDLGVGFVTLTVNAIDPGIGALLYQSVRINGAQLKGKLAARRLIARQIETIALLKANQFVVKVNSVVVPGVNDQHIPFLAKEVGRLGVDLMNLVPLIPLSGTQMAHHLPPSANSLRNLRKKAGRYIAQMHHCTRCRSDAVGCLDTVG